MRRCSSRIFESMLWVSDMQYPAPAGIRIVLDLLAHAQMNKTSRPAL